MSKRVQLISLSLLLTGLTGWASSNAFAAKPLPIIPGAHGFGMETPAGSGRHLNEAKLKPGWDKALVAHWDFDDGKPGGTLQGDAKLIARGKGHALRLNGKGGLSLAKAKGYIKPGGSFTFMAWVRMEAPFGTIAQNVADDKSHWQLAHVRHGVQKWMFLAKGDSSAGVYRTADVTEPKWRHVAAVYDGATGKVRFYINASSIGATRREGPKQLAAARCRNLTIGKGLKGLVDDVMLFNAALTHDEILALHAYRHSAYFGAQKTQVIKVTNLNTKGPGSLRAALDAVLAERPLPEDQMPSIGCNIKWKKGNEPDYFG